MPIQPFAISGRILCVYEIGEEGNNDRKGTRAVIEYVCAKGIGLAYTSLYPALLCHW